jgi:hypothetical protein
LLKSHAGNSGIKAQKIKGYRLSNWQKYTKIKNESLMQTLSACKSYVIALLCSLQIGPTGTSSAALQSSDTSHTSPDVSKFEGYTKIVEQTHQTSLAARESVLNGVVAEGKFWIDGAWGETLWCLAALYQNQHIEQANQQLLARAQAYNKARLNESDFRPETIQKLSPWGYFALTDYVRILSLFHANSSHYPGRLQPETEMAMKEALWNLVKVSSKVKDADLKNLLVLHGTENHDLTLRPNYYLVAALLKGRSSLQRPQIR